MWRLFRRGLIPVASRHRTPERVPLARSVGHDWPSVDGHSVEILTPEDAVKSIRFDQLTSEQLKRVLAANNCSVHALTSESTPKGSDAV